MRGVRFGAVCVLAGTLVSSAALAAPACDLRSLRACKQAATQSHRELPRATRAQRATRIPSAQRAATAPSAQRVATAPNAQHAAAAPSVRRVATAVRTRRVARQHRGVRHAQSARPARRTTESSVTPPIVPHVQETSPAARRFSEFVSPRLLAANPVEELRKPRMNVSEFSGQTAYPVVDRVEQEPTGAAVEPARAASPDPADERERVEPVPAADQQTPAIPRAEAIAQLSANPVSRAGERDSSGGSASWVQIVFLTWGGLLTVGSALRLLIG